MRHIYFVTQLDEDFRKVPGPTHKLKPEFKVNQLTEHGFFRASDIMLLYVSKNTQTLFVCFYAVALVWLNMPEVRKFTYLLITRITNPHPKDWKIFWDFTRIIIIIIIKVHFPCHDGRELLQWWLLKTIINDPIHYLLQLIEESKTDVTNFKAMAQP